MAKDPAVLFYTSDFISGTELFSFEQKGQYIHLLCIQHQNGHLPSEYMEKILVDKSNPVWRKFKQDENGLWYQWRMDEESERRKKYSDSRRKNVSSRYEHTHEDTYEERMKLHMETETETETENININKKEKSSIPLIKSKVFIKPTTEEVKNYALEAGLMIDSDAFCDYFKSNGWKVGGRAPMKDWRAAVRNWCRRDGKPKLTNAQKQTLESFKQFDERMKRDAGHI